MEDAERPRRMYLVAIAQHEIDVFQLNIAQHVHARRRWRRGQRKRQFWTKARIQRRRQFSLYGQLMVELQREDPYYFKNFMRMPPEMFNDCSGSEAGSPNKKQYTRGIESRFPCGRSEVAANLNVLHVCEIC